jgi:hypothetical protein
MQISKVSASFKHGIRIESSIEQTEASDVVPLVEVPSMVEIIVW